MMPDSPTKVKPQRPHKARSNASLNDPITRLVREAQRIQDRRRRLEERLTELRPGLRSPADLSRVPHPKGIDPAEAGRIAAELQSLQMFAQPLADALEEIRV